MKTGVSNLAAFSCTCVHIGRAVMSHIVPGLSYMGWWVAAGTMRHMLVACWGFHLCKCGDMCWMFAKLWGSFRLLRRGKGGKWWWWWEGGRGGGGGVIFLEL